MSRIKILILILFTFCGLGCSQKHYTNSNYKTHIFYYNWYGNPSTDGKFHHWAHDILPHWSDSTWDHAGRFPGGENIGANYYPSLGTYSSNDPQIIKQHMEMIKAAGVGVLVITWWGKDSYEDQSIQQYLDIANDYDLKISLHLEPFYTNIKEFKTQLEYINQRYTNHPAFYKINHKPLFYVYDSYKLPSQEWKKLLDPNGNISIRNTSLDAVFIGLWVEENDGKTIKEAGFDGFYTYFASDGFVYGSSTQHWQEMSLFAKKNNLIFIPCVGPGYIDTRIRPWNAANTKHRDHGNYYKKMFQAALQAIPNYIGITSFNEWHEGTQIEPSTPKKYKNYIYEDFSETQDEWFYIHLTKKLVKLFK